MNIRRPLPSCRHHLFRRFLGAIVLVCLVCFGALSPVEAAKKKKGDSAKAEAELKKTLDPLAKQLNDLTVKMQGRLLFSPKDAGELFKVKYQLVDLMNEHPTSPLIAKPVYQAGVLFQAREEFTDAYELFGFLANQFPASPYGIKARGQIQQLEKRFGPDHFPKDLQTSLTPEKEEKKPEPKK